MRETHSVAIWTEVERVRLDKGGSRAVQLPHGRHGAAIKAEYEYMVGAEARYVTMREGV